MRRNKILITGITGHIAPHLAYWLIINSYEVHGILRGSSGREYDLLDVLDDYEINKIKFHYLDLRDYDSLKRLCEKEKFDGIFHLASQSHPAKSFENPILTFESNVMGSVNLFRAIEGTDTRCVIASTSEVYGNQGKEVHELHEDMKLSAANPYSASKIAMDVYADERIRNGFLNGIIVRPFSHCAPRRGKIFSISSDAYQIAKIMLKRQEPVLKVGNLNTERVVIDARDVVQAYYLLMIKDHLKYHIYNVCGSPNMFHKMEYFTNYLISLSGMDIKKEIYEPYYRKIDIQRQWGNSDRIREIGWKETIPIKKTLKDLLNYWIKKLDNIKKTTGGFQ